jgi:hypothetical protein
LVRLMFIAALALIACGTSNATGPAAVAASCPSSGPAVGAATPTQAPVPAQPVTLSGHGNSKPEFDAPAGYYTVTWKTTAGTIPSTNFAVLLYGSSGVPAGLVNEIVGSSSGQTNIRLQGGHYQLDVSAATLDWSLTFTRTSS